MWNVSISFKRVDISNLMTFEWCFLISNIMRIAMQCHPLLYYIMYLETVLFVVQRNVFISLLWFLLNLLNCVSYSPSCQRALRAYVPRCLACLRDHVPRCLPCLRAHVPTCLTCLRAHVPTGLACLRVYVPTCLACLRVYVPTCLACFLCLRSYVLTWCNYK